MTSGYVGSVLSRETHTVACTRHASIAVLVELVHGEALLKHVCCILHAGAADIVHGADLCMNQQIEAVRDTLHC